MELNYLYSTNLVLSSTLVSPFMETLSTISKKKHATFKKRSHNRIKHIDGDDLHYLEMTLVADKYTIAFHGDTTTTYLLMLANLVG